MWTRDSKADHAIEENTFNEPDPQRGRRAVDD